jgi:steroid 5-alpha reductase family enzyme
MLGFIAWEAVADEQQWVFQTTKWGMIKSGKKLEELPEPFNLGFNTRGLWAYSRHPNYLGEQAIWICFYVFSIGAGIGIFKERSNALVFIARFRHASFLQR